MSSPFILGREEWLSLPELGLPAIKAKVDTGARTSSLHAFDIAPGGTADAPTVRFRVHPLPGRPDVEIACAAPLVGRRVVASSNGERELRFVVRTMAEMSGRRWPIELSLTNRERMAYRMLLGRRALQDDMLVRPGASFLQPRLGSRSYRDRVGIGTEPRREASGLTFAILTSRPESATSRQLVEAVRSRGHAVETFDRTRVSLFVDPTDPALLVGGAALGRIDAVIARSGARLGPFSLAVLRQLELTGSATLNPVAALRQLSDPLAVRQVLSAAHLPVASMAASYRSRGGEGSEPAMLADGVHVPFGARITRVIVVGAEAAAALERPHRDPRALAFIEDAWTRAELAPQSAESEIALAATHVLGLKLAAIDMAAMPSGPLIIDISPSPAIALTARLASVPLAERIVAALEDEVRSGWSG